MPLELRLVVEEAWTKIAGEVTARGDLSLDCDSMRPEVMVELRHRVELLRALTADVLLDFVVSLHVIVEVGDLSEGSTAVHLDADERTLASVQSSVVVKICDLSECFAAIVAKIIRSSQQEISVWNSRTHQT